MARNLTLNTVQFPSRIKRECRRQPGHTPYPIKYCNHMADFDIWHHMFLSSYLGSLTMHQFLQPPATILDLGCGTGYWAIEAAKRWQSSKIYGYDISEIQPQLDRMGTKFGSIARRIEWVHGNFLDGLPFPSNHFDFVRIAGLGLAIPEDEWQSVLEDVRRVLKPGGILEIIEEDLLFPCSSALIQKPPQPSSPSSPSGGQLPIFDLYTNKTLSRDMPNAFYGRTRTLSRATSVDSFPDPITPVRGSNPSHLIRNSRPTSTTLLSTISSSQGSASETEHPQDHTRLKTAWDAMLATRFLSPNLLSVIPFYLTSSSFVDTKAYTPLVISLPPNSGAVPMSSSYSPGSPSSNDFERSIYDLSPSFESKSSKTDGFSFRSSLIFSVTKPQTSVRGTMHLAKTVSTIQGCKEAIWKEYDKLYSDNALHLLSRTAPKEDYSSQKPVHTSRKAFEVDWKNWELDMTDRIGMRSSLVSEIPWVQSIPDTERDRPEWVTWRETLDQRSETNNGHLIAGYTPSDSCRSLRIFTGFKATDED